MFRVSFKNVNSGTYTDVRAIEQSLKKSGKIFGVLYVKKDGEVTELNGRFGVTKFLKGGKRTVPPAMWVIWENNRKRYTAIEPERIIQIRTQREHFVNFNYQQ